ncbi:hypothetical protein [Pararhodobacter sp. SW119]|nr:hypothetical protein [Pararhodobacter sp. SW119]
MKLATDRLGSIPHRRQLESGHSILSLENIEKAPIDAPQSL